MMAGSGTSIDSSAFQADLVGLVARTKIAAAGVLMHLGLDVQNRARAHCPVDTGRLRSSIMAVPGTTAVGPYVEVGTSVDYAPYVELGTRYMSAQPYLRPALAEVAPRIPEALRAVIV